MPVTFDRDTIQKGDVDGQKVPDCYGFRDDLDPSCKRCKVREECLEHQAETRPDCFSKMYDESSAECSVCLDASQCQDTDTEDTVSKKFKIRRLVPTAAKVVEPVAVEEEVVAPQGQELQEAIATPDAGEYIAMSIPQLRAELEARGLNAEGRKSDMIKRLLANDEDKSAPAYTTAVPMLDADSGKRFGGLDEAVTIGRTLDEFPKSEEPIDSKLDLSSIMMALQEGQAVIVTRLVGAQWRFELAPVCCASPITAPVPTVEKVVAPKVAKARGLRGVDYDKEVLSPEYWNFQYEDAGDGEAWSTMSAEEKVKFADKMKVEYEEGTDTKVTMLNLFRAVSAKLGIEKYKPQYKSKAARDAMKA